MAFKAYCPQSKNHLRFIAPAILYQEWLVDLVGNWQETLETQVLKYPSKQGEWHCYECGAVAEFNI